MVLGGVVLGVIDVVVIVAGVIGDVAVVGDRVRNPRGI